MLDDSNVLKQRDPENALGVAANEWKQVQFDADIINGDHDGRPLAKIVIAGMGGSALAALLAKALLEEKLTIPLEVVREYELPTYVSNDTLVIVSSSSGNTEETLGALSQARERGAQIAIMTSGGKLLEQAKELAVAHVVLPDRSKIEPRMTTIAQMRALARLLGHFNLVPQSDYEEIASAGEWLESESAKWLPTVSVDKNYAKELALIAVGKTPVFYGGRLTGPLAYKWKISWNENAKNVAFWNVYPEANHNEFIGWTSHPVEKPFAVFDLKSSFEHERILKRFEVSDRLLSGLRPKATPIQLEGDTPLKQLLWGCILADFVSIYVAILNGVDPTPVALVEKLKKELI
jgi:glucose/mannose-6-phosphate isomerase